MTPVAERARRRVTLRLMPFLVLVYLTAYLDRANVGIAKLQMQGALHLTDEIIGFGAGIFFIGYFLLEIPGSLIVERWSARRWLARIMITWGMVATLSGFAGMLPVGLSVRAQFYGVRFLLGAAEAGFFPGVVVYLSHWFRQEDRSRAKAWFMISQPLSIVIGLPISRWILETVHWHGLAGWRWVFILEGIPPIILGLITLRYLTDRPHQAKWLPDDEKEWLMAELAREERERTAAGRVGILDALRQPQTALLAASFFLIVTGNQAILFFLPSITDNMKSMSIVWRTVVTVLPYLCSIGGILLNGYLAHRTGRRTLHTALPMILAGASLAMAILSGNHLALVIAFFCLVGLTFQAYLPVFWSIPSGFLGKSAAATAVGLINSVGNLGGFVGPYVFGYLRTATGHYETGLWCLTGCMLLAGAFAGCIRTGDANVARAAVKVR
ncbi:MAG TPA: MFS transporter [Bryobacteraceae bacterium]|nr:MFS transporter [Bryobacteraceae bacterium]